MASSCRRDGQATRSRSCEFFLHHFTGSLRIEPSDGLTLPGFAALYWTQSITSGWSPVLRTARLPAGATRTTEPSFTGMFTPSTWYSPLPEPLSGFPSSCFPFLVFLLPHSSFMPSFCLTVEESGLSSFRVCDHARRVIQPLPLTIGRKRKPPFVSLGAVRIACRKHEESKRVCAYSAKCRPT